MKRIYVILCILLYSFSAVGASITNHYCAGKLRSCQCSKPAKKMGVKKDTCCTDKTSFHKKQDLHAFQAGQFKIAKQLFCSTNIVQGIITVPHAILLLDKKPIFSKAGLIYTRPPIYKLVRNFLI